MLRSVAAKTLRDQGRALFFWAVGIGSLAILYPALWPSFGRNSTYSKIFEQFPETYRTIITAGLGGDLGTATGYLNTELYSFLAPLLLLIYAVTAGANGIAGEEERGTLDLLLANPVARSRVVLEKALAMALGTAIIGLALWLVLWVGVRAWNMDVGTGNLAAATVAAVVLGVAFGSLSLALGAWTGRRGVALGVTLAVAVLAYFVNALAPVAKVLMPYRPFSPFRYYSGHDPLRNGLHAGDMGVLVGLAAVFLILGVLAFRRRDLAA